MGPKITVCLPITVPAVKIIFMKHLILTEYLLTTMLSSFIDDAAALVTEYIGAEGTLKPYLNQRWPSWFMHMLHCMSSIYFLSWTYLWYIEIYPYSLIFQQWDGTSVEFLSCGRQSLFILHNQYHGCWCLRDTRSHGINIIGIDLVLLEYFGFSTGRVERIVHNK